MKVRDRRVHYRKPCLELRHERSKLGYEGFCFLKAVLLLHGFDLQELILEASSEDTELLLESIAGCNLLGLAKYQF